MMWPWIWCTILLLQPLREPPTKTLLSVGTDRGKAPLIRISASRECAGQCSEFPRLALILPRGVQTAENISAGPDENTCRSIVKAHGFLSRAQFQCRFRWYSPDMLSSARECSRTLGEDTTKQLLMSGMQTFDRNEQDQGHDKLCQDILVRFPGTVRN